MSIWLGRVFVLNTEEGGKKKKKNKLAARSGSLCGTTGTFHRIQTGMEGFSVGRGASAGSHSGMFQLTGHVLPHCSVAAIIRVYAYKACWEQASDIQRVEIRGGQRRLGAGKRRFKAGDCIHFWRVISQLSYLL